MSADINPTSPTAKDANPTQCGFIAIIGPTNAGKSTLVNTLVGSKVTIVSHKVQTTRVPVRGIAIEGQSQLVFIDTPGIFNPKRRLDRAMVDAAWGGTSDADAVVLLSKKRIGALFAIQRNISLKEQLDTGVVLDARFTPELAISVFFPKSPLHDGGMIIADDRVAGAACVFPVTEKEMKDRSTGLRHRAAIGLTERTDAIAIVVSEEDFGRKESPRIPDVCRAEGIRCYNTSKGSAV